MLHKKSLKSSYIQIHKMLLNCFFEAKQNKHGHVLGDFYYNQFFFGGGGGIFLENLKKAKRFEIILASMVHVH